MPGPQGQECALCNHWAGRGNPNTIKAACQFGPETRQIVEARAEEMVATMQAPNLDTACKSPLCQYDKQYYFFEFCTGRFQPIPP